MWAAANPLSVLTFALFLSVPWNSIKHPNLVILWQKSCCNFDNNLLLSLRNFFKAITHCYVVMSCTFSTISIGNSMICSDIWHKYHQWYFKIVILRKLETIFKYHEWYLCQISHTNHAIINFVYTTRCKRFVLFTCRYFKLSWNTTILTQSNCRKFSCSSITTKITIIIIQDDCYFHVHVPIFKSSRHITHSPFSCSSTSSEKKHWIWFTSLL